MEGTTKRQAYGLSRVLVVDDNSILLRTVKDMLDDRYFVSIAASCEQAFKAIRKNIPDIILLDFEMPDFDGAEVLKMLRELDATKDIPIIFFTGRADKEIVTKLISLKPAGYLLKPPNKNKLIDLIQKVLSGEDNTEDEDDEDL